ncbi:MAG: tRNA-dihydrouridine synthase family protein [Anaerolineae bacterium]|jgi:tRNA-dihydrouridine synthase B|nr:tRNA-dihydrouridine synthase family protein [Anaerolineae bacterium]MBT7075315.1 tRNA-dihydrouridine synthase family protein [Anaerolineae bacterium]MBT7781515.1 tRNA-dihydrouridine synthase family protein [Anaerolineae bacterium]
MPQTPIPNFYVDKIPVYGDAILAPMMGFSDLPYRSLCRELGSAISYTEFARAEGLIHNMKRVSEKLEYIEEERPITFQIYTHDIDYMVKAALNIQPLRPDFIDINMGCPTKAIANSGAGVGLMRTPIKVARLFKRLVKELDVPITAKIRIGWDDCQNYKLISRIVEEAGASLIAIHGRTREGGRERDANWDVIGEVKQIVNIPVIGNGDVKVVTDIEKMKKHTGCDGVMIGRAAIGNPWIFSGKDREEVAFEEVRAFMEKHLDANIAFYGEALGINLFRKHVVQYIAPMKTTRRYRRDLLTRETKEEFLVILGQIYENLVK